MRHGPARPLRSRRAERSSPRRSGTFRGPAAEPAPYRTGVDRTATTVLSWAATPAGAGSVDEHHRSGAWALPGAARVTTIAGRRVTGAIADRFQAGTRSWRVAAGALGTERAPRIRPERHAARAPERT